MSSPETERWEPDEALVLTVRTRCLSIKDLSGPDRSWIVANLTVQGWTVAAIAARLKCSPRLVQTIKTEPMTRVAMYALELTARAAEERSIHHVEKAAAASQIVLQQAQISRLSQQRDALLCQVQSLLREQRRATAPIVPEPRRRRRTVVR